MTIEEKVLLKLLAAAINGTTVQLSDEEKSADWESILKESVAQAVALTVFEVVTQIKEYIPSSAFEQWTNMVYSTIANNTRVENNQRELVDIIEPSGYHYAIIKGEAAASYYLKPELRLLGDVDFLIEDYQQDQLRELFEMNGYTSSMDTHICHLILKKPGAHLEMHFEPAGVPNGQAGEKVRDFLKEGLRHTKRVDGCNGSFSMLEEPLHALVLLLHMQHHILGEGIGLRHLCDWACFVARTAKDDFWQKTVIPQLKEIGLYVFASVMTEMCCDYLEVESPLWLEKQPDKLCEEMMLDIFEGGNFGRKDKVRDQSGIVISNRGKDGTRRSKAYYMFYKLKAGYRNKSAVWEKYPSSKKLPLLYPFFYIRRLVSRLVDVFIRNKIPIGDLLSQADQRKAIYDKLHIFEVE